MNPFTWLQSELDADKSTADYCIVLRYLLPLWAAVWADNPASYANAFTPIAANLSALADSEIKERMLRFVVDLQSKRQAPSYGPTY